MCPPLSYALVCLDAGPKKPLTYAIPESLLGRVKKGTRVAVPVRNAIREGTVSTLTGHSPYPTKPIAHILNHKLPQDLLALAEWIASYTLTPLNTVIKTLLPGAVRKETPPKTQLAVQRGKSREKLIEVIKELRNRSPAQAKALETLLPITKEILATKLCEEAGVTHQTLKALESKGLITLTSLELERSPLASAEYLPSRPKTLHSEQQEALDKIEETLTKGKYETHLLHGVTGSGKTEIYLQAIGQALALKKGCILLIPEISLTTQTVERIRSRFEGQVALLHHRLSQGERIDAWRALETGKVSIAIGPRSAIFSPVKNLGLIIVDEEHESAYKQSDSAPLYHGRDVAVMRGHLTNACVILGSATPSLESLFNAQQGKYRLSKLNVRAETASLPSVQIVDMNQALPKGKSPLFSPALLTAIKKRFEAGEQTLLFLNRRGYHSLQWCPTCKEAISCPHCSLSLTYHKSDHKLSCHLCAYTLSPPPKQCPTCKEAILSFKGAGTEQVERALNAIFPDIRTLRIDADTTRHKGSHERLFRAFRSGKADVLIGTQMIAKGLHFPAVTLVGILNSDISLQIPDFRASENVFQLITQVAGRAGRGSLSGEVLIQTWMPDHPTIQLAASGDHEAFYEKELQERKLFAFPPFSRLIKLSFSGPDQEKVFQAAEALHARLATTCDTLPICPAGYSKVKGNFRFQFLLRGPKTAPLAQSIVSCHYSPPKGIRLQIDVDPLSTYF